METKNIFYVYKHVRKDDGVIFYIGKGKGKRAWGIENRNPHWQHTVEKHGYDIVMIAENIDEKQSLDLEVKLIAFYGRNDKGNGTLTNMTDGGDGVSGYVYNDEQREARSIRTTGIGNHMYGKSLMDVWSKKYGIDIANKMWEDTRSKMGSIGDKNVSKRPEVRVKQSEAHKGKPKSEEHRKNLSIAKMGKSFHTDEQRKKTSENTKGSKNPNSILTEDNVRFIRQHYKPYSKEYGMKQLAKMFGVSVGTVDGITRNVTWVDFV
jgi:hypothetical protein